MNRIAILVFIASMLSLPVTNAQSLPPEQIKSILNVTKGSWVAFRDYDGKQLIYFTHLEAWKCGLIRVQYGINDAPINKDWLLDPCNSKTPNRIQKDNLYLTFAAGSVLTIDIILTFDDGTESESKRFSYAPETALK
ncbi:MAG: hypothetical protein JKY49_05640 [Cohaesibacteraceae bacterium]|nr:hypothetical protein [Cohaesibacteraceae bacterium]MBL4876767.1 hypothetical protein [Cohaesibacteraceae bacterium]